MLRHRNRLTVVVLVLLLVGTLGASAAESKETTRIFLVRHAEKAKGDDPPLTDAGRDRAAELARVTADAGIVAIYSSQFNRTRETAAPTAKQLGVEVEISPLASATLAADLGGLAERILKEHPGETVMVTGHSNTVPMLIEAFGVTGAPELTDQDYDDLFVVSVEADGQARLLHLHYGARTP